MSERDDQLPKGCSDPEHPDGAFCWGTTGLHTCYAPGALACSADQPGNLSDPAAAAENSEGCGDCGEPWWAHRREPDITESELRTLDGNR